MITAAFDGPYAPRLAWALLPDIEPMATMAPRDSARAGARRLGEEPRGAGVDREELVPVLDGVAGERARTVDSGVAHEAVEAAESLDGFGHHASGRVGGAHVAVEDDGLRAECARVRGRPRRAPARCRGPPPPPWSWCPSPWRPALREDTSLARFRSPLPSPVCAWAPPWRRVYPGSAAAELGAERTRGRASVPSQRFGEEP